MNMKKYEDVFSSKKFLADLDSLNGAIVEALSAAGEPIAINGNVCYFHLEENFHKGPLSEIMEPKRRALFEIAQRSKCFVELGVAGGHALLVALHANPEIRCIGIDLAKRLRPAWPPVDVFVPAAFRWFEENYPDRTLMIVDDAISGLKQITNEKPFGDVDLVHLDADKRTRFEELQAIWPALAPRALLLQGGTQNKNVTSHTQKMIENGLAAPLKMKNNTENVSTNFEVLKIGTEITAQSKHLKNFYGKNILVCVAHQDDEVLFAGGFLEALRGHANVTIASFFRPAKGRKDTNTRIYAMEKVCAHLGATCVQYPFSMERGFRPLWRNTKLADEPESIVDIPRNPVQEHPLYQLLHGTAYAAIQQFESDIIITHNSVGEYGHRQHIILHHAVLDAAQKLNPEALYTFGYGLEEEGIDFYYDQNKKRALFDYYLPEWDGVKMYHYALKPERLIKLA